MFLSLYYILFLCNIQKYKSYLFFSRTIIASAAGIVNNSETVKAVTLAFWSIQQHFIRDVRAKFGISNFAQSPDIGKTQNGVFPVSGFLFNAL